MHEFTIIIPVYNEELLIERNTKKLIEYLKKLDIKNYEIIISSNGSTDETNEIGKRLDKEIKEVKFIYVNERGAGLAFNEAIKKAKYDKIISVDMDLSINLDFIPRALDLLFSNDIVIGSKKFGEQDRNYFRLFISNVYLFLVRFFLGINFSDYSIAAKAYKKKSVINYLDNDKGTFYVIRLVYLAYKNGLSVIEIPVSCKDNRKSKFNIYNEIFYRFKKLVLLSIKKK